MTSAAADGRRAAAAALALLGQSIARARRRRGWTQSDLARKVGITQARQSQIESGRGGGLPAETWFGLARALDIPFRFELGRDGLEELEDAGHLEMQEYMLALARQTGRPRRFELMIRPIPGRAVDVGMRDDAARALIIEECWNTFGNLGSSVRSTRRKLAEMADLAVAVGGDRGAYKVAGCWIVRDIGRNRTLLERYPELFGATFDADSSAWIDYLTRSAAPLPRGLGLVWLDLRAKRLLPWRGRGRSAPGGPPAGRRPSR